MKVIHKPWGKEEWLELNNFYCYKRIYINKDYKTSFQYHNKKTETNYIISGTAEIWLENNKNEIIKTIMKENDFFTVLPGKKHRVIAKTDLILQEVSTPEVDDVIRIDDDTNRKNGKIETEHTIPAFCIVASGKGTRLKDLTKNINKALLPINNMGVISHIINKIPKEIDIIITIGYKGEILKEYCDAAHSDRNITFINIENYDKKGNGPGESLLQCKKLLQRPFYFSTVDCIITNKLPQLNFDWIGISKTDFPNVYSTAKIDKNNNVIDFKNKSENGYNDAYIGLSGIYDYKNFWKSLENNIGNTGEIVNAYMDKEYKVSAINLDWFDTGTFDTFKSTKAILEKNSTFNFPKDNEYFFEINNKIIKIFIDSNICKNRIIRSEYISEFIPKITYEGNFVYAYEKIEGETLYKWDNFELYKKLINWLPNFWTLTYINNTLEFKNETKKFYYNKTHNRFSDFIKKFSKIDINHNIDGINCKPLKYYLKNINWDTLYDCIYSKTFHGDLQFDNIIYNDDSFIDDNFKLIDWRQSYGDMTKYGDIYYDLAKLYGGMLISYFDIKQNNFSYEKINNNINLKYKTSKNLKLTKDYFEKWVVENNYSLSKIKTITFLIYVSMLPLHDDNFSEFLYYFSKKLIETI